MVENSASVVLITQPTVDKQNPTLGLPEDVVDLVLCLPDVPALKVIGRDFDARVARKHSGIVQELGHHSSNRCFACPRRTHEHVVAQVLRYVCAFALSDHQGILELLHVLDDMLDVVQVLHLASDRIVWATANATSSFCGQGLGFLAPEHVGERDLVAKGITLYQPRLDISEQRFRCPGIP